MSESRVALVTGAGKGLGKGIIKGLMGEGIKCIALDRDAEALECLCDELEEKKRDLKMQVTDLRSIRDVQNAVMEGKKRFGRINILVNCAGMGSGTSIAGMTEEEWDNTYAVNVKGLFFITQAVSALMIQQRSGRIINISSMAGFSGGIKSSAAYSSSKAAVTCTTKNFAKYLAPYGITVNEIAPGPARTSLSEQFLQDEWTKMEKAIPLGRLCLPEDIAGAVLYLSSKDSAYITGQTIHVNGGMRM